jgi:hypothetical protein
MTCSPWNEITLQNKGTVQCIYGDIYDIIDNDEYYAIIFDDREKSLYLYSTRIYYDEISIGDSVHITGIISERNTIPIIELTGDSKLYVDMMDGKETSGYAMPLSRK